MTMNSFVPIFGAGAPANGGVSVSQVTYNGMDGHGAPFNTNEALVANLYGAEAAFQLTDGIFSVITPPGAGASWTIEARLNRNTNTGMIWTINGTNTQSGAPTGGPVTINPGDIVTWKVTPSSGTQPAAPGILAWTTQRTGTGCYMSASNGLAQSYSPARYMAPMFGATATEATEAVPLGVAGTVDSLFVLTDVAPGGSGMTFSFRKNVFSGSNWNANGTNTALACTIPAGSTTASDTTHSVHIAEDDIICIECAGTAATSVKVYIGYRFVPDDALTSPLLYAYLTSTTNQFNWGGSAAVGSEVNRQVPMLPCQVNNFFVCAATNTTLPATNIGTGNTLTAAIRKNGADSTLTETITGPTLFQKVAVPVQYARGDLIDIRTQNVGAGSAWMRYTMGFQALPVPTEQYPELERFQPRGLKRGVFSGF